MKKLTFLLLLFVMPIFTLCGQNCSVTITSLTQAGIGNPPPAVHISVEGKVSPIDKCDTVKIELCCADNSNPCRTQLAAVKDDGTWKTFFKDFACKCIPNSFVVVATASCLDNSDCTRDQERLEIICQPNNSCCNVSNVATTIGECVNDISGCKKRKVTFTPTVNGNCDGFSWNFEDNSLDVSGTGTPIGIDHDYFHFPQASPKLTTFKAGCAPTTYTIIIPNFTICDDCPLSNLINLNQITSNNCILSGTITADICEEQYVNFVIDYGDGTSETNNINLLDGFQVNHTYPANGAFTFKVSLIKNGQNCDFTKIINIGNCGGSCPEGQHFDASQQKCVPNDDNGNSSCLFCFCSNGFWCCFGFILLILLLVSTIYFLLAAICGGAPWNWGAFTAGLLLVVGLAYLLVDSCGVTVCQILLAIASSGILADWIVCPNIPCTAFLCGTWEVPILGVKVKNIFLISIVIFILSLIFDCG